MSIPKILDAIILKMGISFNYMYVKYFSPDKFSGVLANIKEQFRIFAPNLPLGIATIIFR